MELTNTHKLAIATTLGIAILIYIVSFVFEKTPEELERELKAKIEALDTERRDKIKSMEEDIKFQNNCIMSYSGQLGTTKPILPCTKNILPEANAMEIKPNETQKVTPASNKKQKIGTAVLLKKGQPYKASEGGHTLYAPFDDWRVNSAGIIKPYTGAKSGEELLKKYGKQHLYKYFIKAQEKYLVDSDVLICIAFADSDLGKMLKSTNNIGNVGNNDRGNIKHFKTAHDGVLAIGAVLHNKYLKNKQSIGSLSVGGGGSKPFYATSKENWNANVLNCLNSISNKKWDEHSLFRLEVGQP